MPFDPNRLELFRSSGVNILEPEEQPKFDINKFQSLKTETKQPSWIAESLKETGRQIIEHPLKTIFEAGARYPRALFRGLEALQIRKPILEAMRKGFLPETDTKPLKSLSRPEQEAIYRPFYQDQVKRIGKGLTFQEFVREYGESPIPQVRTPTQISWDMADRMYGKPSTSVAWNFVKYLPYTTAGVMAEIKTNPAIFLTFQGINKVFTNPYVAKFIGKNIPAPKWFDDTIKATIKGFYRPFEGLAENVKESRINAITNEIYKKFESRMDELKENYKQVFRTEPTEADIKGLIKIKLIEQGIYEKPLIQLQKALFRTKKIPPVKPIVKPTPAPEVPKSTLGKVSVPKSKLSPITLAIRLKSGEVISQPGAPMHSDILAAKNIKPEDVQDVGYIEQVKPIEKPTYGMTHRPTYEDMPPAYDLLQGETMPRDIYEHPEFTGANMKAKTYQESWDVIQKIKNKPNIEITVYRASPKKELNPGDWITFSKEYAKLSAEKNEKVFSYKIKAKDAIFAGDDLNEFGYYPTQVESKYIPTHTQEGVPVEGGIEPPMEAVEKAKGLIKPEIKSEIKPTFSPEKLQKIKKQPTWEEEEDLEEIMFEKGIADYLKGEPGSLYQIIKSEGGIAPYKKGIPGALREEYREDVPVFLRNKKGLPLDEMADALKERYPYLEIETESDLLEALRKEQMISMYAGMPIAKPEQIKEVKDWLVKKFDIEYPLKEIGATKTGLALKTYLSKRSAGEEKSLKAIEDLGKFKLAPADYNKLAFVAERPGLFVTLPEEQRRAYSPAYHHIRNYFDNYFKLLKERIPEKFELPWPQSHIRRLQEKNLHLRTAIERTKNLAKAEELKKQYDENKALIDFYRTSKIQYVHLPIRLWLGDKITKNPQLAKQLISANFRAIVGRETPTLEHFIQAGLIKREEVDIRDIMASYGRYVENQLAQKDILDMAMQEGLAKLEGEAPEDWISLPTRLAPVLKGYKLHPGFAEILEQYFNTLSTSRGNIGRVMASIKMMQFYNPFFLPMYDLVQAGMLGSITPQYPKYLWQAIKDTAKKTPEYFKAAEEGLFSQPYANPFDEFMKQVNFVKQHQNNNGNYILDAISKIKEYTIGLKPQQIINDIYNVSWNIAWHLDKVLRMASRNYLIEKSEFSPEEASQLAAKFHSDYASIPPQTRKVLNKIFFTPVFEIAMNKVYIEMVKNAFNPKVLASFKKGMGGTEAEKIKKVFARGLVLTAGILFGKDIVATKGLGFEREQFSRRYHKTVDTEAGEKEIVMVFANPANIPLRYYWKFKADEAETNYFLKVAKTLFARAHPVYRIATEVIRNEGDNFKPVYNPFDDPQYQIMDILKYVTAKSIRVSEGFIRGEEVYTKQTQQALTDATNKLWANILRPITFRYLRNIKDRREAYQIKNLANEFQKVLIREPDMDEAKYQRRLENYLKKLEAISEH